MANTFPKGGIHPPENKLSAQIPIQDLSLPKQVVISVSQHLGAPAKVIVKKKDEVKTGQIIAEQGGFISAHIHSPVSGKVFKIEETREASGYKRLSVIIKVEEDTWEEKIDPSDTLINDYDSLEPSEIIKKVEQAGIVGLGGATFPAHVKLSPPKGMKAEVLLINGVECEPYLTADHQLMLEKGEEILIGTSLLMRALKVEKASIGIEKNKPDAIKHLENLSSKYPGINIVPLKVQYPQGGEKQLIKAITGREVPSGALPIAVGAVVQNVATAFAVYEAVLKNKPLIDRVVTVTGKSLARPSNFRVRIGTPISQLIEAAGGLPEDTGKVVSGGPMMGKALSSLEIPVTKGTSGILILPENEAARKTVHPCIRCAKCTYVCPMGLEPYLLMTLAERKLHERIEKEDVTDCIECGSCSYTCPSARPLLDYIRLGKSEVNKLRRARSTK
ncbi:MAG: electron transport complex subunit RsxC [Bacteroidia bacterium]|nr:MAG: electron transport complex subunit RsxC [Bacteroidia bacterium]